LPSIATNLSLSGQHSATQDEKQSIEQVRINPIHHRAQPIGTGNPEVELGESPQERQMRFSPVNDVIIVVAICDRPAHHQEQHLAQRIGDLTGLTRVLDLGKVIQQKPQPWLG
jgi:hypothetical protein